MSGRISLLLNTLKIQAQQGSSSSMLNIFGNRNRQDKTTMTRMFCFNSSPTKTKSTPTTISSSSLLNNHSHSISTDNGTSSVTNYHSRNVATSQKIIKVSNELTKNLSLSDDPQLLSKEEMNDFELMFPKLVKDIIELPNMRDMPDTNKWLKRVMEYNVPHGKKNRGLATALAYRYLADTVSEENIQLSYVLGWCTELLQAFFLVIDDIMDKSETRRGNLCWYKVDNIGSTAMNDAILLEASIYVLLKKYFYQKDYYVDLLEIMHEATYKTIFGQSLDTRTGLERNIETYTMERYSGIVKYKTSYYSFSLPIALGMAMARITEPELKKQATEVTLEMGHLFQVQDDYLDCFGDPELTGKIGTDIQDCKCSWLCVVALQKATPEQKIILMDNYGIDKIENIERIKQLYIEMNIPKYFNDYEEQTHELILKHIQQIGFGLPKQLFIDMLQKTFRRSS